MSVTEVAVLIASVLFAAAMQVTAGFGFALLAVPLMALALDTHDAVVVSTFLGLLSSSAQAVQGRREIDRTLATRLTVAAMMGIPLGLIVFRQVDEQILKVILGISVLVATVLLARRLDLGHHGPWLDWVAGVISGALSASLSTNGPPLVFALQSRRLPISVFRSTISFVFCLSGVATLVAFAVSGEITGSGVRDSLIALPAMSVGLFVGFRLRNSISEEGARRLVIGLLGVAGISASLSAILS